MSNHVRRVNLYGGPGSGKSTLAAWLFSRLKMAGIEAELVPEYIKGWVYEGRAPGGFDQVYILGKQLHEEERILRASTAIVVAEAPLYLGCYYAKRLHTPAVDCLRGIADAFEDQYPAVHIFLERPEFGYSESGRYHSLQQAVEIDREQKAFIEECLTPRVGSTLNVFRAEQTQLIYERVAEVIGSSSWR